MIKYICDRCDKEVDRNGLLIATVHKTDFEICKECCRETKEFLNPPRCMPKDTP